MVAYAIVRQIPKLLFERGLFPAWQQIPAPVRAKIVNLIVPKLPRRSARCVPTPPIVVVGQLTSTTSFGWVARRIVDFCLSNGVPCYRYDVSKAFACEHYPGITLEQLPQHKILDPAILIIVLNPNQFRYAFAFLPEQLLQNKYIVGCVSWELERVPPNWVEPLHFVDEIWACSEFARASLIYSGTGKPCYVVPPLLSPPLSVVPDRERFSIPASAFVILVAFSLRSGTARKNPLAGIEAFRRAFPVEEKEKVKLVIKVADTDVAEDEWNRLKAYCQGDRRIILLDEMMDDDTMWSLIASVDVYLSPHRAEGFGMICAQAMLLGRTCVATNWSGNLDFMSGVASCLMPYSLVPAVDPDSRFRVPNARWAEIDVVATAETLRRLYLDPDFRQEAADSGRQAIRRYYQERYDSLRNRLKQWQFNSVDRF